VENRKRMEADRSVFQTFCVFHFGESPKPGNRKVFRPVSEDKENSAGI
jgi:hypothetical protein